MDIDNILSDVCSLATRIGEFQLAQRATFDLNSVERKGDHDYVSYVDKESERMIVEALTPMIPEAEFITEEKTTAQSDAKAAYTWIIDPLDGTTNYIHNLGPWCVCIALRDSRGLLLGVVYEAVRGELYYAKRGQGAWMRDAHGSTVQLHVSKVDDVDQALVMIGFPYNAEDFRSMCTGMIYSLYGHCASIRSMGSAEAELCYVAAGRIDVYFESYLKPWDVSAGAIIVKEAGGRVSDYNNEDKCWESGREVLATNGVLHDKMIDAIWSRLPY